MIDGYSGTYAWSSGAASDKDLGVAGYRGSISGVLPSIIPGPGTRKTGAGLTSGEINDFAKWIFGTIWS